MIWVQVPRPRMFLPHEHAADNLMFTQDLPPWTARGAFPFARGDIDNARHYLAVDMQPVSSVLLKSSALPFWWLVVSGRMK